jgi:hypothetical protein
MARKALWRKKGEDDAPASCEKSVRVGSIIRFVTTFDDIEWMGLKPI